MTKRLGSSIVESPAEYSIEGSVLSFFARRSPVEFNDLRIVCEVLINVSLWKEPHFKWRMTLTGPSFSGKRAAMSSTIFTNSSTSGRHVARRSLKSVIFDSLKKSK
jgi:hypothetical protein